MGALLEEAGVVDDPVLVVARNRGNLERVASGRLSR
jgi:hypothetical protein